MRDRARELREETPEIVELIALPGQHAAISGLTGYINAGGRGTRLSSIFAPDEQRGVAKALLPIGCPPTSLVEHQINKLDHAGISTIVVGVGDHENVADYVHSVYDDRPNIHTVHYSKQLGHGGDLVRAVRDRPELFGKQVLVTCVDVVLDIDEARLLAFHQDKGGDLTIALTRNKGVPNEGAYYVSEDARVIYCGEIGKDAEQPDARPTRFAYRGSSTGALIASTELLHNMDWQAEDGSLSIYSHIVAAALGREAMFAFDNGNRLFTDVGTVASWEEAQSNHDMITSYIPDITRLPGKLSSPVW